MQRSESEIRHYRRYRDYDYSRGAVLFVTIVTYPRRPLFGKIVNARLVKTPLGEEVERSLDYEGANTPGLRLYERVVMPDHVHFRVYLEAGLDEPLKVIGGFVRRFKTWTTRYWKLQAGLATQDVAGSQTAYMAQRADSRAPLAPIAPRLDSRAPLAPTSPRPDSRAPLAPTSPRPDSRAPLGGLWQQGYHDWLCLSREMIDAVARYIIYNPLKYELRYNQPEFLALHEPLAARRLSPDEFWRGIGAVDLLDGETPFISLRITRKLSQRQIEDAVSRIRRRAGDFVFVGGWISPGEKAVRDMLLAEPQGKIVQLLPSAMPHDFLPGSVWLPAIRDNRAAIIAHGNSDVEFSRVACLEVNDEARKIATAAPGKAIYWRSEGPTAIS